ncbi:MAG: Mov34/MPN/PAD-1 family protein [Chloroflexi bacterium]|nr:Mov34/MPN/PAD-1 family protein [Chloroflexota bacterium]
MIANYHWIANQGEYLLVVQQVAWQAIVSECFRANDRETGGILIGYYTNDQSTANVTEALPAPKDSKWGQYWFVRGVTGLSTLLLKRWANPTRRTFYLGEWHFHPSIGLEPSDYDFKQMKEISYSSNYHCKEPIMLIIGQDDNGNRPVRVFVFPRDKNPYEYQQISKIE